MTPSGNKPDDPRPSRTGTRPRARILIVGGDAVMRASLVERLNALRHRCTHVGRFDEARSAITERPHDLVLLNPDLPDGDGLDLARQVRETSGPAKTIVFSEKGSFRHALRSGAADFIRTPIDLDEFAERVDAALASSVSERERERKLDRLQDCSLVIRYYSSEMIWHHGYQVSCLISEFVEGELLADLIDRQPGGRLTPFEALHLVLALARGLEQIHLAREYHGDLHPENVLVRRRGVSFDLKLVDFFHHKIPKADMIREDIVSLIHLLYGAVGGRERYAKAPKVIKDVCLGLRRDLIVRKFPTAAHLRRHLESFPWPDA